MIPNQWVRQEIVGAVFVNAYEECNDKEAQELDGQMIQVIQQMERTRDVKQKVFCPTIEWWQKCMRTRPLEEASVRIDDPGAMLDSLAGFYGIANSIAFLTVDGDRFPTFEESGIEWDKIQMVLVQTPELSKQNFEQIPIAQKGFTITACIVHGETYEHWQVCLRDPREEKWYRYNDKEGRPFALPGGEQPVDIRTQSYEPEDKQQKGFPYQPRYWFYVRTAQLEPLQVNASKLQVDFAGLPITAWDDTKTKKDLIALFGGQPQSDDSTLPWTSMLQGNSWWGILQVLTFGPTRYTEEARIALTGVLPRSIEIPNDFVSFVNEVAIERYLRPLVERGEIGKSIQIVGAFRAEFLNILIVRAQMGWMNAEKKLVRVRWGGDGATLLSGAPYLKPRDDKSWENVGYLWASILQFFLLEMMEDSWNQSEVEGNVRELSQEIEDNLERLNAWVSLEIPK
jgi:hypothetical protein